MSKNYEQSAETAEASSKVAHARDIGELHDLAASNHRIAAEYAYQDGNDAKRKEHENKAGMHAGAAYSASAKEHPDTSKGGEELTGKQIHFGAMAKNEFKAGKNPPSWVEDEDKWDKAKTAASKTYDMDDDAFWPVVVSIYENMGGEVGGQAKARMAAQRRGAISAQRMSGNAPLMASIKGNGYSLMDLQQEIASACEDLDLDEDDDNYSPCCYCCDIIAPAHETGETWEAVLSVGPKLYCVSFKITDDHEVSIVGDPKEVNRTSDYDYVNDIETEAKRADKLAKFVAVKAGDSHMNKDGTFKGGFDGCVLHMKDEGYSEESAKKICGKIAQEVGAKSMTKDHALEAAKSLGLKAGDFKGNQHKSAHDVAAEHSAAATVASRAANAASRKAVDKQTLDLAAGKQKEAATAHQMAAEKNRSAGNEDKAKEHEDKADKHQAKSDEHNNELEKLQVDDGKKETKARTNKSVNKDGPFALACYCAGANPLRSLMVDNLGALNAATASMTPHSPTQDNVLMYMPAGTWSICPSQDGEPVNVTVLVDIEAARKIDAQRAALESAGKKPFFSVQHETEIAAFWPSRFFWDERLDATGKLAEGIWVEGEWTQPGKEAVEGKAFRTFSPTFFVDAVRNSVERPAKIVCNEQARANMGALENDPAFQAISPLWCRNGGGSKTPNEAKTLVRECHNEMRKTSNPTLGQLCSRLKEKHKVKLSEQDVAILLVD